MDFTVSEAAKTKLDAMLQERGLTDVFFVMSMAIAHFMKEW